MRIFKAITHPRVGSSKHSELADVGSVKSPPTDSRGDCGQRETPRAVSSHTGHNERQVERQNGGPPTCLMMAEWASRAGSGLVSPFKVSPTPAVESLVSASMSTCQILQGDPVSSVSVRALLVSTVFFICKKEKFLR